jgi:hypothetical protein
MKTLTKLAMVASIAACSLTVSAQVFDFNINPLLQDIPDGGVNVDVQNITFPTQNPFPQGFFLKVKLNIQGLAEGFPAINGDYYSTLTHGGQIAVLLNRPGRSPESPFGYGDNGMNVTIQDFIAPFSTTAANDIHTYKTVAGFEGQLNPLTGVWAPDARGANPGLGNTGDTRNSPLSAFNGTDPNGEWVLFVQDMNAPGGLGKLVNWGLEFTAVPEPHQYALMAGFALIGFALYRRYTLKPA